MAKLTDFDLLQASMNESAQLKDAMTSGNTVAVTKDNYKARLATVLELMPNLVNEFITTLTNKIVKQRVFDPLKGYVNPFQIFYTEGSILGDAEEILNIDIDDEEDYADSADPFSAKKPVTSVSYIKTEDKKVWTVKLSEKIVAAAMTSERGLTMWLSAIMDKIRTKKNLYMYRTVVADLKAKILKTVQISEVAADDDGSGAKQTYKEIMAVALKMTIPSKGIYNDIDMETFMPKGSGILVLNPNYQAAFDINVMAALFNSSKVGTTNFFKEVILIEEDPDVLGYILAGDKYLINDRILVPAAIYNPRTMESNNYLHNWIRRGVNPGSIGVKLVKKGAPAAAADEAILTGDAAKAAAKEL